jgi:hypothetical protein
MYYHANSRWTLLHRWESLLARNISPSGEIGRDHSPRASTICIKRGLDIPNLDQNILSSHTGSSKKEFNHKSSMPLFMIFLYERPVTTQVEWCSSLNLKHIDFHTNSLKKIVKDTLLGNVLVYIGLMLLFSLDSSDTTRKTIISGALSTPISMNRCWITYQQQFINRNTADKCSNYQ